MDYKKRFVEYKAEGHTFKEWKESFKKPPKTYYEWKEKLENGYYEIKERTTNSKKIDGEKLRRAINVIGGLCNGNHLAVECYAHATNSAFFEEWFEGNLLKEIPPKYTVVWKTCWRN